MPTLESVEPFAESSGRGATAAPRGFGSTPRELPVLFRMSDVAQEKRKPVTAPVSDPAYTRAAALEAAKSEAARLEGVKKSLAQTEHLATKANQAVDRGRISAATTAAPLPAKEIVSEPATPISRADISARPEPTKADVTNTTPPTAASAPTPRQRAELRERRAQEAATATTSVKSSAKSSWFSTHGKVIAIGFVICLVGTVCLARMNRQKMGASALDSTAAVPVPTAESKAGTESPHMAPSSAISPTEGAAATAATSPASPGPDFSAPAAGKSDESLFPWKGNEDARTATRPDAPRNPIPAYTPIEPTSPATPEGQPEYPQTDRPTFPGLNSGDSSQPNSLRQGDSRPKPSGSPSSPASLRSPNPTSISGIRHER